MDWLIQHKAEIAAGLAAIWGLVTVIVGLTPSTADDSFIRRLSEKLSLLSASNAPGIFSLPGTTPDRWVDAEEHEVETDGLADELEPEDGDDQ